MHRLVGLGTSGEADVAVGEDLVGVAGVVDEVVVVAAQADAVVDVGLATLGPGFEVVGLGPGGGDGAALAAAVLVAQREGTVLAGATDAGWGGARASAAASSSN